MDPRPPKRLVHVFTLLQMFKEVGYERAIMEKRARAGKPYKDDPGPPTNRRGRAAKAYRTFCWAQKYRSVISTCGQTALLERADCPIPNCLNIEDTGCSVTI